jgi:Zn-dependent protease with chaperone function
MLDSSYSEVLNGFDWQFNLIDNDTMVNAWAMPGGKVAFYSGILPVCKDDLGIVVVMGHEVAHAIAKHGQERMSQIAIQQYGMAIGGTAMG